MERDRATPGTWVLTDGHAGNVRQAVALADALGGADRNWHLATRAPWRWLAPRRLPGAAAAWGTELRAELQRPPRLAIGCGRQAALATRVLRAHGARAVQILHPRLDTRYWDVVIAPEHDGLRGANVVTLLGSLHPVDERWLAEARAAFAAFAALPAPRTAVLVGGTSAHARFDTAAWREIARRIAARVRADGGSVLLTTSRRTPAEAVPALRAAFDGLPGVRWSGEADGTNPYPGMLAWADRIVGSADSVNMLSEAAATAAPLYVAGHAALRGRPRRFVEALFARDRARAFDDTLAPFAVQPLRETARVAAEVRQRLGLTP
ncbi:MAG TPA: mitochondrial fission ELM1 family protein [Lysobacter sp.]|nr:mitochondrial fission ELM1 family protein [Lysobacter sp.]